MFFHADHADHDERSVDDETRDVLFHFAVFGDDERDNIETAGGAIA
jgi:hypothetical protein